MKHLLRSALATLVLCCVPLAVAQTPDPHHPNPEIRAAWHGTLQTEVQRLDADIRAYEQHATAERDAAAREQMTRRHADFHRRHADLHREAAELEHVSEHEFAQRHHDLAMRQARLDSEIRAAQLERARTRADFDRAMTSSMEAYDRDMRSLRERFQQAQGISRARYAQNLIQLRRAQDDLRHRHVRMQRMNEAQYREARTEMTRDLANFRTTYTENWLEAERRAMRDRQRGGR